MFKFKCEVCKVPCILSIDSDKETDPPSICPYKIKRAEWEIKNG